MQRKVCLAIAGCALLAGCGGGSSVGTDAPPASGVNISAITGPNHLQIGVKAASFVYKAAITGTSNTALTWSVDDPSLATIDAKTGVATPSANKTGTVTITATASADAGKSSSMRVQVVDWILVGPIPELVSPAGGPTVPLIFSPTALYQCAWAYDHLTFVCSVQNLTAGSSLPTQLAFFQTDGTLPGTTQTSMLDLHAMGGMQYVQHPHFSPDGKKVIFEGWGQTGPAFPVWGAWIVAADGQSAPVVAGPDSNPLATLDEMPRFTPDGSGITYESNGSVWLMNVDGTNAHQLIAAPASNAVFAPDMSTVYYDANGTVYKSNADGSNPAQVGVVGDQLMDVSPNGRFILVTNLTLPDVGSFVMNTDGSGRQRLAGALWGSW